MFVSVVVCILMIGRLSNFTALDVKTGRFQIHELKKKTITKKEIMQTAFGPIYWTPVGVLQTVRSKEKEKLSRYMGWLRKICCKMNSF